MEGRIDGWMVDGWRVDREVDRGVGGRRGG